MQPHVQYQHYIPQFILRNFSHRYKSRKGNASQNYGDSGPGKRMRNWNGDKVLNIVDLVSDEPQLREVPVSRWFGQENMYNDATDAIESQKNIEKELSNLEAWTAEILQKVKEAHEKGEQEIYLDRSERDRLRKFLFIMKYRGPGFFGKYTSGDPNGYQWEDKNLLRSYMAEKGFENPRDVWLHNLRAILDLEMDAEGEWMTTLPKKMFPADAAMFTFHVQSSYTTFCTPSEENDEFILTDQCYNVFEGPFCETRSSTGDDLGPTYLCFHEFGPITARLIIVLRSIMLPETFEDANQRIRDARKRCLEAAATQFPNPETVKSILADLPVAKAMKSSTGAMNGRREAAQGETGKSQSTDKFCFRFWPIEKRHVGIINSIFLDNILHCKSIVFRSSPSFMRTLEGYMTSRSYGFKTVGVGEHRARISRRIGLEKLSIVLKALGSDKLPVWNDDQHARKSVCIRSVDDLWLDQTKKLLGNGSECALEPTASSFWETYRTLGGTNKTFLKDLEQSWRLYQLQAFVSKLSSGLGDPVRLNASANVVDLILAFDPRRVWLYVKHLRWMFSDEYARLRNNRIGTSAIFAAKTKALMTPEREDEIVKSKLVA